MERPYFHRIQISKMDRLSNLEDEIAAETEQIVFDSGVNLEDRVPEEGQALPVKVESYRSANKIDYEQPSEGEISQMDKIVTIKMPKALLVKEFNIENVSMARKLKCPTDKKYPPCLSQPMRQIQVGDIAMQNSDEQNLSDDELSYEIKDQPIQSVHINRSNKVFKTHHNIFQSSFDAAIYLPKTQEYCYCHLDDRIFKISVAVGKPKDIARSNKEELPQRVRYFAVLKNYGMEIKDMEGNCLQITLFSKRDKEVLEIQFRIFSEKNAFQCVHMHNLDAMKQLSKFQPKEDLNYYDSASDQNSSYLENDNRPHTPEFRSVSYRMNRQNSIDSLKFTVERVRFQQLHDTIETFDIVLFKSQSIMSKMQRFFTGSGFDHVALLMKAVNGDVLMLEATGNNGVAIYSFLSLRIALRKKFYDRLAVRKLVSFNGKSKQKTKCIQKLQNFVKQVNGKQYKFDPMYLFRSVQKNKLGATQEQQTFFCSQLVAEALKVCGILKEGKPSYKYLPRNFGDIEGLNQDINEGYFYSDLMVIED